MKREAHVPVLDGVRGLAILLVMWCHLTDFDGQHAFDEWFNYFAYWGSIGVDLFFVLSGYLITGILLDTRERPRFFKNFYARRALRIFPLYYAVLALSLLVVPAFLPPDKAARFGQIHGEEAYYCVYLQTIPIARAGETRHAILDITWSLAIEEQFYLLWPMVVFLCSPRRLKQIAAALFVAALGARLACQLVWHLKPFAIYVLTPCRMDALAAGTFLAVIAREPGGLARYVPAARRAIAVLGPVLIVLVTVEYARGLVSIWAPGHGPVSGIIGYSMLAVFFGALVVLAVEAGPATALHRVFASRPLTWLGTYSYGLYLVHLPIRALIRDRIFGPHSLPMIGGTELLGQLVFYALASAAILPVAWLSYHAYEKRFLGLKRYFSG